MCAGGPRTVLWDRKMQRMGADAISHHQLSHAISDAQAACVLLGQGMGQLVGGSLAGAGGHATCLP